MASPQNLSAPLSVVSSPPSITLHYVWRLRLKSAEGARREMERGEMITTHPSRNTPTASPKEVFATFPQFSKLPVELQIEIWLHYIQTRVTGLASRHNGHSRLYAHAYHFSDRCSVAWTRCFDISPALQVCRLSRETAYDYYLSLSQNEKFVYLSSLPDHCQISEYFQKYGRPVPQRYSMTGSSDYMTGSMSFLIFNFVHWQHWDLGPDHAICTAGS